MKKQTKESNKSENLENKQIDHLIICFYNLFDKLDDPQQTNEKNYRMYYNLNFCKN